MQAAFAKSNVDLENLESVFVAFEMAQLLDRLGVLEKAEVAGLPHAMRRLIIRTLEASIKYPVSLGAVSAPDDYDLFAKWLRNYYDHIRRYDEISIITFNYDCAIDYALGIEDFSINYNHGGDADPISRNSVDLLKLHGSLNWTATADGQILSETPKR